MRFLKYLFLIFAVSAASGVVLPFTTGTESHAQYRGRAGGSSGMRGRSVLPSVGRSPSPRAAVIRNRSGGFDMYSPRGHSRYLGESQGNKVFHPDGTSSTVILDSTGGSTVAGPQGSHRIFPDADPYTDE